MKYVHRKQHKFETPAVPSTKLLAMKFMLAMFTLTLLDTAQQVSCFHTNAPLSPSKATARISRSRPSAFGTATKSPLFLVLKGKPSLQQDEDQLITVNGSKESNAVSNSDDKTNGSVNGENKAHNEEINGFGKEKESLSVPTTPSIDIIDLISEINDQIIDGSDQLFKNMTENINTTLSRAPDTVKVNADLNQILTDMTRDIQKAQRDEIQRQLDEIERRLVRPFEDFAFSDAKVLRPGEGDGDGTGEDERNEKLNLTNEEIERHKRELVKFGVNSTWAESSRRLRSKEIVRNLNVAPFYYSVTLLLRWCRKVSAPPLAVLTFLKGAGSVVGGGSGQKGMSYDQFIEDGEAMQNGWKRTGEIAAKGKWARKWAIMRRSLEIWAYFSSFYIKEKRMNKMFEKGRWSEERFSEERSKLGEEVTQSLLKLGPTFIKVRRV